jgi:SAM-dependent methyltransferase
MQTGASTLSTSTWQELPSEAKFLRYTSVLGLPRQNADGIKQRLRREFPQEWRELEAVIKRREHGDMSDDLYALKNRNLRFSLLATYAERVELHAKAFSMLERISEPLSKILDVGCENGLLTCLLALRWPNAQVMGIDSSTAAVARAGELASILELKNVTFVVGAAEDIATNLEGELFDLITTITVLHDGGLLPSVAKVNKRNAEVFSPLTIGAWSPAFSAIAAALGRSGARWVSMERCKSPATFSAWCQAFDAAGLGIDCRESQRVPCEGDILSVVVAGHDRPHPIDFKKIHGLWISPGFNRWGLPTEPPWVVCDQQAEAIFAQLHPKTCIDRIVAWDGNGREVERLEVWEAATLCLLYIVNPSAERTRLQIRAITDLPAMRDRWKQVVAALRGNAPADTRFEELHQNL